MWAPDVIPCNIPSQISGPLSHFYSTKGEGEVREVSKDLRDAW